MTTEEVRQEFREASSNIKSRFKQRRIASFHARLNSAPKPRTLRGKHGTHLSFLSSLHKQHQPIRFDFAFDYHAQKRRLLSLIMLFFTAQEKRTRRIARQTSAEPN